MLKFVEQSGGNHQEITTQVRLSSFGTRTTQNWCIAWQH